MYGSCVQPVKGKRVVVTQSELLLRQCAYHFVVATVERKQSWAEAHMHQNFGHHNKGTVCGRRWGQQTAMRRRGSIISHGRREGMPDACSWHASYPGLKSLPCCPVRCWPPATNRQPADSPAHSHCCWLPWPPGCRLLRLAWQPGCCWCWSQRSTKGWTGMSHPGWARSAVCPHQGCHLLCWRRPPCWRCQPGWCWRQRSTRGSGGTCRLPRPRKQHSQ